MEESQESSVAHPEEITSMRFKLLMCVCIFTCMSASTAVATPHPNFVVVRAFTSGSSSANSFAPLIADGAGNLYGTASTGGNGGCVRWGSTGCGTVFKLAPPASPGRPWTETVLYRFPGGNGPWWPTAGLTMDLAGNLFGTTTDGNVYSCFTKYCGTAFELSPPSKPGQNWTETILYRFAKGAGGNNPGSGLTLDAHGNLYGTTQTYGPNYNGTVYRLSPPAKSGGWWKETVLSGFERGGQWPIGNVAFDKAGNLYGTTFYGGFQNFGLVFELSPTSSSHWAETVLYEFGGNACAPKTNLIFDKSGNLYGTAQGCPALPGAVFQLRPPLTRGGSWSESVLSYFNGQTNYDPSTSLTIDGAGNLYGTTAGGGAYLHGTVFELKAPTWTETVLHSFKGWDGDFSTAGPVFGLDGALYGTTSDGGYRGGVCKIAGCGVVFKVAP
jgi:uncharacterized repeat protein (TIGR03803 family)